MINSSLSSLAQAFAQLVRGQPEQVKRYANKFWQMLKASGFDKKPDRVYQAVARAINAQQGIQEVVVETPLELTSELSELVRRKIINLALAPNPVIRSVRNNHLIAGVKITIGDQIIDLSLARQLSDLEASLTQ